MRENALAPTITSSVSRRIRIVTVALALRGALVIERQRTKSHNGHRAALVFRLAGPEFVGYAVTLIDLYQRGPELVGFDGTFSSRHYRSKGGLEQ
jgi:hypothetical protein